jgi:SAM-dependent methyltransferase
VASNPSHELALFSGNESPMSIEEVNSEEELAFLFKHIQDTWQTFGETEPHWSVITAEQFLQENIKNNEDLFFGTGEQDLLRILHTLERNGIDYSGFQSCLEYGCGIGRVTLWLAGKFTTVHGYDISGAHLQYAEKYLGGKGITNVSFHHVKTIADIFGLPPVDLIYSVIVLQHNPPPLIGLIVREFIKALNPGGVALFQVPTYRAGYKFSLRNYPDLISRLKPTMEMHVFPQKKLFEIIQEQGGKLIEIYEDNWTGLRSSGQIEISNTLLVQKAALLNDVNLPLSQKMSTGT